MRFGRLAGDGAAGQTGSSSQNIDDEMVYDGLEDYLDDGSADSTKRFMRFGKRFMRFGRSLADGQYEPEPEERRDDVVCFYSGKDGAFVPASEKRFMRFGRMFDAAKDKLEASMTSAGSHVSPLTSTFDDVEEFESRAAA